MKSRITLCQSGFTLIEIIATVVVLAVFSAMMLTFLGSSFVKSSDPIKWLKSSSSLNKVMANITADYNQFQKWKSSTYYNVGYKVLPISMNGRYYTCVTAGTSGTIEPIWRDDLRVTDGNVVKWDVKPWRWSTTKAGMWQNGVTYSVGDIVIPRDTFEAPDGKVGPNGHFYRCKVAGTSGNQEPTWSNKTDDSPIPDGTGTLQWTRLLKYLKENVGTVDLITKKNNAYGQYYVVENKFIKFVSNNETAIVIGDPENVLRVTIKNDQGDTLTALFVAKEN